MKGLGVIIVVLVSMIVGGAILNGIEYLSEDNQGEREYVSLPDSTPYDWEEPDTTTAQYKAKMYALSLIPELFYNYGIKTLDGVPLKVGNMIEKSVRNMDKRGIVLEDINRWQEISRDKTTIIGAVFLEDHIDKNDQTKRNMWFNVFVQNPRKHRKGIKDAGSSLKFQVRFIYDTSAESVNKKWKLHEVTLMYKDNVVAHTQDVLFNRAGFNGTNVYLNKDVIEGNWDRVGVDLSGSTERSKPIFYNMKDFSPKID